jgi:hypothetical protein
MAQTVQNNLALGQLGNAAGGTVAAALNSATTYAALSFPADAARTLSSCRVYLSAVTGTLATSDLRADLYSDSAGVPGTLIQSSGSASTATAGQFVDFTGFSTALTAGRQYWIVLKNLSASPASNFPTYLRGNAGTLTPMPVLATPGTSFGWNFKSTTNGGTSWLQVTLGVTGLRVGFSDGGYAGGLASSAGQTNGLGFPVFGSRELGAKLTTPAGAALNVAGAAFALSAGNTPSADCRFRLYAGTTLLATTATLPASEAARGQVWACLYFPAVQQVQPNTVVRAAMGLETNTDTSDKVRLAAFVLDPDANSLPLMQPYGACLTYFNGSAWSDDTGKVPSFALLLDAAAPFAATSGTYDVFGRGGLLR